MRVRRSASGVGVRPLAVSAARMKESERVRGQVGVRTAGGETRARGWKAHQCASSYQIDSGGGGGAGRTGGRERPADPFFEDGDLIGGQLAGGWHAEFGASVLDGLDEQAAVEIAGDNGRTAITSPAQASLGVERRPARCFFARMEWQFWHCSTSRGRTLRSKKSRSAAEGRTGWCGEGGAAAKLEVSRPSQPIRGRMQSRTDIKALLERGRSGRTLRISYSGCGGGCKDVVRSQPSPLPCGTAVEAFGAWRRLRAAATSVCACVRSGPASREYAGTVPSGHSGPRCRRRGRPGPETLTVDDPALLDQLDEQRLARRSSRRRRRRSGCRLERRRAGSRRAIPCPGELENLTFGWSAVAVRLNAAATVSRWTSRHQ